MRAPRGMRRTPNIHPTLTRHNPTNKDPIQAAIKAYEAQEPELQYTV
jgi:hypothetical protein